MKHLVLLFILCFCSPLFADFTVVYDAATGDIMEYGLYGSDVKKGDSKYGITQVKETAAILKNPVEYLRYDSNSKTIVKKSNPEITAINNAKRKAEILVQVESLLARCAVKTLMVNEGFNSAAAELIDLKDQIAVLKTEYVSIP